MRKGKATPRIVARDPQYQDRRVGKFINCLMKEGKKSLATKIFYDALAIAGEKMDKPGIEVWREALENVMPTIEAVRRRAGGVIRQVPSEVRPRRKVFLGMKWIIKSARNGHGKSMQQKLANELIAASQGEGNAIKQKNTVQKIAESNKAFAYLR